MSDFKFTYPKDCDNAPKKATIKKIIHAFASKEPSTVSHFFTEDIYWEQVNNKPIIGKDNLFDYKKNKQESVTSLHIERMITHGKFVSVDGTYTLTDGSTFSFCHILTFLSAGKHTINAVKSFLIKQDD